MYVYQLPIALASPRTKTNRVSIGGIGLETVVANGEI